MYYIAFVVASLAMLLVELEFWHRIFVGIPDVQSTKAVRMFTVTRYMGLD